MIPEKIQSFRKTLLRNNLITVLCLMLVLVSFILNYLERRETLGKQLEFSYYVATDGEVIPAQYAQRRDNIEIEIRHHLAMFVDDWYALTQDTWEAKAEAAGWLGGNSIRDMYIARREAGFFNRFIQGNIRYEAKIAELQISPNQDGTFSFEMVVDLQEKGTGYARLWRVFADGSIQVIERSWPNNPHGLWIEPFLERKIIQVKDNEQAVN